MQILMAMHWTQPAWLLLALLPLCAGLLVRQKRQRLLAYAEPHLRPWAVQQSVKDDSCYSLFIQVMAWGLLGAALADPYLPQWDNTPQLSPGLREDVSLMIVLDVSAAMTEDDVTPRRNERARIELVDLLQRLRGERTGLIVYARQSGMVMPLSDDHQAFLYYLQQASLLLPPSESQGLSSALSLAARELRRDPVQSRAVLLVTSASSESMNSNSKELLRTIDSFSREQLPLYVLAVSDKNTPDVDHDSLMHIAEKTAGRFAAVENGDSDWVSLYDKGIYQLDSTMMQNLSQQQKQPCFSWFILPALILFLFSHLAQLILRWKWLKVLLPVLLILGMVWPVYADEATAHTNYREEHYLAAQIEYSRLNGYAARTGEGASAYRREDWKQAIASFTRAALHADNDQQRADALYNLGNAFYRNRQYLQALEAYQAVFLYRSEHPEALHNLQLARHALQNSATSGLSGSEEYGRYDESVEMDMEEESADTQPQPLASHVQQQLNNDVASGAATAQAEAGVTDQRQVLVLQRGELAASLKKLELVDDQNVQLLGELLDRENEASP